MPKSNEGYLYIYICRIPIKTSNQTTSVELEFAAVVVGFPAGRGASESVTVVPVSELRAVEVGAAIISSTEGIEI